MSNYLEEKHNIMGEASDYNKKDIEDVRNEIGTIMNLQAACRSVAKDQKGTYSTSQYILVTNILSRMAKERNISIRKRKKAKETAKQFSTTDNVTRKDKSCIKAYKRNLKAIERNAKKSYRKIDNTKVSKYKGKVKNYIGGKRYKELEETIEKITESVVSKDFIRNSKSYEPIYKRNEDMENILIRDFLKNELVYKSSQVISL